MTNLVWHHDCVLQHRLWFGHATSDHMVGPWCMGWLEILKPIAFDNLAYMNLTTASGGLVTLQVWVSSHRWHCSVPHQLRPEQPQGPFEHYAHVILGRCKNACEVNNVLQRFSTQDPHSSVYMILDPNSRPQIY